MRIIEHDLRNTQLQLRRLASILDEAADRLATYEPDYAAELRVRAWTLALTNDPGAVNPRST